MINNKSKIIITIIVLLLIIIAMFVKHKNNLKQLDGDALLQATTIETNYDEETGLYYIRDENTNQIIYASDDENDPELQFYKEHPDYNPTPLSPRSTDLSSFASYDTDESE